MQNVGEGTLSDKKQLDDSSGNEDVSGDTSAVVTETSAGAEADGAEGSEASSAASKKAVNDGDMDKQILGKPSEPLQVNTINKDTIEKVEKVKKNAEEHLAKGPSSFNKQVIRTEFYRDNFTMLVRVALVNCVVMTLIVMSIIFYMFQKQPDDRFFATTVDGRIMQLIPLDTANMTRSELYSWVVQAVNDTLTFGYHDYQRRLQDSTHYFTRDGWESFADMLQRMRLIESIGRHKLVVKAVPRSAPELEQEAVFNGRYRWVLKVDFNITMQGKSSGGGMKVLPLRLTIERVPVLENIKGVAIKRWDVISG